MSESEATTESLRKRDREVGENGVVNGKAWIGIVAGTCGLGAIIIFLIVFAG